jgi:phosphinothricin acetyltransferase
MSPKLVVRPCTRQDLPEVCEIYALEVREGTASFELEPPSIADMAARVAVIEAAGLPYLVVDLEGRIAGYAYASPYRPRPAYRHTVEDSVYVARWARRQGVGRTLLEAVIQRATERGMRQMVAIIGDSGHVASIRLHAQAGFRLVGTGHGDHAAPLGRRRCHAASPGATTSVAQFGAGHSSLRRA